MDESHAREMIDFARRWIPYGGAHDEDIWMTFGLTAAAYRSRLAAALNVPAAGALGSDTRNGLAAYAQRTHPASPPLIGQ